MARVLYHYRNQVDSGSVYLYSNQLASMPADRLRNEIRKRQWGTEDGFVVHSANNLVPFRATSTVTVWTAPIASGTYTGSGLASVLQSALNGVGPLSDHTCQYNSTTEKFLLRRSTGTLQFLWTDHTKSSAYILGFDRTTDSTGTLAYSGTATLGNEHFVTIAFTATQTVMAVMVDEHLFSSGSLIRFRLANTASAFTDAWNASAQIGRTGTLTYRSGLMGTLITSTTAKAVQLYVGDRDRTNTRVGRLWAGPYSTEQYKNTSETALTWTRMEWDNRSRMMESEAGALWIDRRQKRRSWRIQPDAVDPYYNSATMRMWNDLLGHVEIHRALYVQFSPTDLEGSTVYGYFTRDFQWRRVPYTPMVQLEDLELQEQL